MRWIVLLLGLSLLLTGCRTKRYRKSEILEERTAQTWEIENLHLSRIFNDTEAQYRVDCAVYHADHFKRMKKEWDSVRRKRYFAVAGMDGISLQGERSYSPINDLFLDPGIAFLAIIPMCMGPVFALADWEEDGWGDMMRVIYGPALLPGISLATKEINNRFEDNIKYTELEPVKKRNKADAVKGSLTLELLDRQGNALWKTENVKPGGTFPVPPRQYRNRPDLKLRVGSPDAAIIGLREFPFPLPSLAGKRRAVLNAGQAPDSLKAAVAAADKHVQKGIELLYKGDSELLSRENGPAASAAFSLALKALLDHEAGNAGMYMDISEVAGAIQYRAMIRKERGMGCFAHGRQDLAARDLAAALALAEDLMTHLDHIMANEPIPADRRKPLMTLREMASDTAREVKNQMASWNIASGGKAGQK